MAELKARLTVLESVYHQPEMGQPTIIDTRHGKFLKSSEQPYDRITEATEEWKKLETGWLTSCSLLVIKNESGQFSRIPTKEELERILEEKVLEVSLVPHSSPPCKSAIINPQESMRITPVELSSIKIRCRKGSMRFRYVIMPE